MTKEEKLKEAAKEYADSKGDFMQSYQRERHKEDFFAGATSKAAKEYHEREWTKCDVDLPEYLKDVLVECVDGIVRILYLEDWESGDEIQGYQSGKNWVDYSGNVYEIEQTVQWLPLPIRQPPKTNQIRL